MFERKEVYSIDDIKRATKDVLFEKNKKNAKIILGTDIINGNSQRYQTFFSKGCSCVKCKIEGQYFVKERTKGSKNSFHLNLYAIDKNGNEILMTKDHIIPKSKGGKNYIDNYQTMCIVCNNEKGNQLEK